MSLQFESILFHASNFIAAQIHNESGMETIWENRTALRFKKNLGFKGKNSSHKEDEELL